MPAGIYRILNEVTGRYYYGGSKDIQRRVGEHRRKLKQGKHGNRFLQSDVDITGIDAVRFETIIWCSAKDLVFFERRFLAAYWDNQDKCYNISKDETPGRGLTLSRSHRERISAAIVGRKHSAESRAKMSDAQRGNKKGVGHKMTEEHKQIIRKSRLGKTHSEETKRVMSEKARARRKS